MPTYEYKCTSCDYQYETRQGFDAPSREPCPRCGATAKRMLFPPPIVFKGSGFYVTDSRKGSSATVGDMVGTSSDSKNNGSSSSNGTGTDSKPAAATTSSDE